MAKKKAAAPKVTKAQAIRDALKQYRKLMPKEIAEKLSATGLNVTANEVSIYKYQMKAKKRARKAAAKTEAPADRCRSRCRRHDLHGGTRSGQEAGQGTRRRGQGEAGDREPGAAGGLGGGG